MTKIKIWNRLKKEESGQALVLVVLMMTVLLGFTALVIDLGMARIQKNSLQSALDAASLAAASDLPHRNVAEATARKVMELNGFSVTDIAGFEYPKDNAIKMTGTKEVKFSFAQVLGFTSMTVRESATAEKSGILSDVFKYTLFSGESSVVITGNNHKITGNVYGKTGISISGPNTELAGVLTYYSGKIDAKVQGGAGSGQVSTPVSMPDFSGRIASQGIVFENEAEFLKAYQGKTVDRPIYVKGNLTINGRIPGTGIIYADSIVMSDNYQEPSDSIVFYAGGSAGITLNGTKPNVYGILYAPNGGLTLNGTKGTNIYGRVIVKNSLEINGAGLIIKSGSNDLNGLDTLKKVRLTE